MSRFREWEPNPEDNRFRFEDSKQIKKLLEGKKLTDKQREAIRRLYATYQYMQS